VIHQPVSVILQCSLNAWLKELASRDQRRLMGSGSALEAFHNDALHKWTVYITQSLLLKTTIIIIKMTSSRSNTVRCASLEYCRHTLVISVTSLPRARTFYHTWRSHRQQNTKLVVICGNAPEFHKWGPDTRLRVILGG